MRERERKREIVMGTKKARGKWRKKEKKHVGLLFLLLGSAKEKQSGQRKWFSLVFSPLTGGRKGWRKQVRKLWCCRQPTEPSELVGDYYSIFLVPSKSGAHTYYVVLAIYSHAAHTYTLIAWKQEWQASFVFCPALFRAVPPGWLKVPNSALPCLLELFINILYTCYGRSWAGRALRICTTYIYRHQFIFLVSTPHSIC